jgi:isopenicillin N synthase-like dioxygenase
MDYFNQHVSSSQTRGTLGAQRLADDELPVIDVEPLLRGGRRDRAKVAEQIGKAARDWGFFYICNHGVSPGLLDRAYGQAARFFEQPLAHKLRYDIARSPNHRGYVPVTERGEYADEQGERHYEAFDSGFELAASDPAARAHYLMGPNLWPRLPGFRQTLSNYYRAMYALGCSLCRGFELHLGLAEGYFDAFTRRPTSQLRLLHYLEHDAPPQDIDMNMGAHTDYECFTMLHQSAPGLQVLGPNGQWIEAPPLEGTFVVNIGDMMEVWSNGTFRSNVHRVVSGGRERFSMPFFFSADYDALIEPVPTMVRPGYPRHYPVTVAGHHLMGQLLRDFSYLRARHAAGQLELDFEVPHCNPFEYSKLTPQTLAA